MSLNWARFQLALQLQKTLLQPDIKAVKGSIGWYEEQEKKCALN